MLSKANDGAHTHTRRSSWEVKVPIWRCVSTTFMSVDLFNHGHTTTHALMSNIRLHTR